MRSTALVVLGMHRSGTSAFTGSLKCLGVELGNNLYAGHDNINAKGYWEHSAIVDTHDEILKNLNSRWDDFIPLIKDWPNDNKIKKEIIKLNRIVDSDFKDTLIWGFKDPRACKLLPLWKNIFAEKNINPFYILVLRHPLEVAKSLERRNKFSISRSLILWIDYNIQAELQTRGCNRIIITYDQLFNDLKAVFIKLENALNRINPVSVVDAWSCIESFIESDLRHHSLTDTNNSVDELQSISNDLFNNLKNLTTRPESVEDRDKLDTIYYRYNVYFNSLPSFLIEQIKELHHDYSHILTIWRESYRSLTWKLSSPIRYLERKIKTFRNG